MNFMKRAVAFIALLIICQFSCELLAILWFKNEEDYLQKCDFENYLIQQQSIYREFKDLLPSFKSNIPWTTMVRQYLSDCFPTDERGNDPTLTADLSEISFPDQYDTAIPLGLFRINQAIRNFSIPENDKDIAVPDYINVHKEILANEQQRAGYTIHKRVHFKSLVFLGEACQNEEAPFIFNSQKIISLMHERNMPFEIPCFTCLRKLPSADVVNNFYILPRRDIFAPISFGKRVESFDAYELDILKEEEDEEEKKMKQFEATAYPSESALFTNESNFEQNFVEFQPSMNETNDKKTLKQRQYHRIPFAAFLYNFATKKFTDPNYEDKRTTFRGPFLADRWWDRMVIHGSDLDVALPIPDGRLRVNPDPGRLRQYYPHFNSMTVVCAQQVDGDLVETNVIVNVDTLVEDPIDEKPECLFSLHISEKQKRKCTTKYHSFRERRQDDYGKLDYRYRIRDYQSMPTNFQPILKPEYNLKIDIGYELWSCCTACCCTKKVCGREFALDRDECKKLESYRSRLAYMAFFKIDPLLKVSLNISAGDNNYMEEVIMTFDKYLSSDPYFTTGIPIHSTLMITDAYWRKLRKYLIEHMLEKNYMAQKIKGRLGLFVETESCDDLQQKLDCEILEKCRENAEKVRIFGGKKRTKEVKGQLVREFEGCGAEANIEKITINALENFGTLKSGNNYLISINETFFGAIIKVTWKAGPYDVSDYNYNLPCSLQRIAIAPDKKSLLIIEARMDDTRWPYIAKAMMSEDGSDAYFKIILDFLRLEKNDSLAVTWTIVILSIFTILSTIFIIVYIIKFRKKNFKQSVHKETPV